MKIAVFDDFRIGVVVGDSITDVTPILPEWHADPAYVNSFIRDFDGLRQQVAAHVVQSEPRSLTDVTLRAPIPKPTHLLAAPLNYQAHRDEMKGPITAGAGTAEELGFFIKATGSVASPNDPVLLPALADRRFDFEGEVAVVVGHATRAASPAKAMDSVFGYTILIDMTLRMDETHREERTMRKSFATFSPMGPWIVTRDEVGDPKAMTLRAWRNGELRQEASLSDLLVDIPTLVSRASHVLPLEAGDVYTTGSPAGVGQVVPGDVIEVEVPQIGRLRTAIELRGW